MKILDSNLWKWVREKAVEVFDLKKHDENYAFLDYEQGFLDAFEFMGKPQNMLKYEEVKNLYDYLFALESYFKSIGHDTKQLRDKMKPFQKIIDE